MSQPDGCICFRVWPERSGYWRTDIAGLQSGPYNSWSLAFRAASADAKAFRQASGAAVRVSVEGSDGTAIAERCMCDRFNPS